MIGIHAPVTGASPIPQTSFDIGKDIYWKFLAESAPDQLFGRKVRVVFRDDTFNPQTAVQVCREMVEEEGAFLLVGGGGADQITACAQYADENGIPYLSAGVNEDGLADLETYFATTLTYAEQAPLLMQLLQEKGITDIGLVVADTPSFNDAHDGDQVGRRRGRRQHRRTRRGSTRRPPSPSSSRWSRRSRTAAPTAVVLLVVAGRLHRAGQPGAEPGLHAVWLGPGVTSGLNAVTNFGCPAVETGEFFSPTPSLDVIDQLDPDFRTAYAQFAPADATGRRHRAAAVVAEQGAGADARGDRAGARPGGVHEHARDARRGSTTASTRRSSSPSTTTSAAPAPHLLDANCDDQAVRHRPAVRRR